MCDRAADLMTGSRFLAGSGIFLCIQTKFGTLPPLDSSDLLPSEYLGKFPRVREERMKMAINPLNAELNPICHLLVLLRAHHILHINRIRVNCILSDVMLLLPHCPFVFMI